MRRSVETGRRRSFYGHCFGGGAATVSGSEGHIVGAAGRVGELRARFNRGKTVSEFPEIGIGIYRSIGKRSRVATHGIGKIGRRLGRYGNLFGDGSRAAGAGYGQCYIKGTGSCPYNIRVLLGRRCRCSALKRPAAAGYGAGGGVGKVDTRILAGRVRRPGKIGSERGTACAWCQTTRTNQERQHAVHLVFGVVAPGVRGRYERTHNETGRATASGFRVVAATEIVSYFMRSHTAQLLGAAGKILKAVVPEIGTNGIYKCNTHHAFVETAIGPQLTQIIGERAESTVFAP